MPDEEALRDEVPESVRARLALALDVDDLDQARALARRLGAYFSVMKVGLQLLYGAGPSAIEALCEDGFAVFADAKLHDIPTTVEKGAAALARRGAALVTVHASGGEAMLTAAVEGFAGGAASRAASAATPTRREGMLAVSVLTSEASASDEVLAQRASLAAQVGCAGVVCAAADLAAVSLAAPTLLRVVPGIRAEGGAAHDQARPASAQHALAGGAGLLVVGRMVTRAHDPLAAARNLASCLL